MDIFIWLVWLMSFALPLAAQTQQQTPQQQGKHHHGRRKAPEVQVTTLAGSGSLGAIDAIGGGASFSNPTAIAVDKYENVYVADSGNNMIRMVNPLGSVTTVAGSAGVTGTKNAAGMGASFNNPRGIAVDANGVLYVADTGNNLIRKITSDGIVSTLSITLPISSPTPAAAAPAALLDHPQGLAFDSAGNLWIADTGHNRVVRVDPAGILISLAGSAGVTGATDGVGAAASFNAPQALTLDAQGNIYVADSGNRLVRRITVDGTVTTLISPLPPADAKGVTAITTYENPLGIAMNLSGNLYVTDAGTESVREMAPDGVIENLAGLGLAGNVNSKGSSSSFNGPTGIAVDVNGTIYVADTLNNMIRKIQMP